MKHLIISVALVLLLAGCPSVPQQPATGPAMRDIGNGVIEHTASGMKFSPEVEGFRRSATRQYDAGGTNVSVGYDLSSASTPIAVTLYVYPSPPIRSIGSPASVIAEARGTLARTEFQRTKNEIMQAHAGARVLSEGDVSRSLEGTAYSGSFARFTYSENFAGQYRSVESLVYVYCYVGEVWTIKYRITYPAGSNAQMRIDRFLQAVSWPIRKNA